MTEKSEDQKRFDPAADCPQKGRLTFSRKLLHRAPNKGQSWVHTSPHPAESKISQVCKKPAQRLFCLAQPSPHRAPFWSSQAEIWHQSLDSQLPFSQPATSDCMQLPALVSSQVSSLVFRRLFDKKLPAIILSAPSQLGVGRLASQLAFYRFEAQNSQPATSQLAMQPPASYSQYQQLANCSYYYQYYVLLLCSQYQYQQLG